MLALDFEGLNLDWDLVAPKTPEQVRRSNASASSATRASGSIDLARGSKTGSLSGTEGLAPLTTQFGANENDMAFFGFDQANLNDMNDWGDFVPSGPESYLDNFQRPGEPSSGMSEMALDQVAGEIRVVEQKNRKRRLPRMVLDEEMTLNKEELLLADGEGLAAETGFAVTRPHELIARPLVGSCPASLFALPERAPKESRPTARRPVIPSSGMQSSDHHVPLMDDEYGLMLDGSDGPGSLSPGSFAAGGSGPYPDRYKATQTQNQEDGMATAQVAQVLRRVSETVRGHAQFGFELLLRDQPATRRAAAKMFYNTLVMVGRGELCIVQRQPYGPIEMRIA